MKIFTVIGTRPNVIKVDPELKQTLIWTDQHYSWNMGMAFFEELELPKPKFNLKCKSSEVGKMIDKLSRLYRAEKPTMVIVFGDTNSSLAGALAAAYQNIPVVHIEAGMRSNNWNMPEEVNRVLIDRIAKVKICPTTYAAKNLATEGIINDVYVVGDPMFDALCKFIPIRKIKSYRKYNLLTIHRNFNADNQQSLKAILEAIEECPEEKFIFPIHPRTEKNLKEFKLKVPKNVKIIKPQTYKQMLSLVSNAKKVLTDSGGVQKEAFWMGVPVIILRTETEWIDICAKGGGVLVGDSKEEIIRAIKEFVGSVSAPPQNGVNKKIREILFKYA